MPTPGRPPSSTDYADPYRYAHHLVAERADQGVDFGGDGPVTAIGPGVITKIATGNTGWGPPQGVAPGGFIEYTLTSGEASGKKVYFAEGITPNTALHVGSLVDANTVLGNMTGGGTEQGWASGVGTQPLSQTAAAGKIGGAGPFPTKVGLNFDQLLVSLGAKPATNIKATPSGKLPSGYTGSWAPQQAQTTSVVSSLLGGALGLTDWKDTLERLGLILLGGALIIVGVIVLAGRGTIKIAMAGIAPEATLADQVKSRAVEMRAKGAANSA